MTKPFQLQSLLDLSNLRLDEAAQQLGRLIAGEQEAGQRLTLLMQYRDEYQMRFSTAAQNGIGPDAWRNYRRFLDRLDQAVEQARAMVDTTKQHTATGQKHWLDQRGRVKAFDTLAERHQARAAHGEARQEQKRSDEHSARRYGVAAEEE